MSELFIYLVKVVAIQAICYLVYRMFLADSLRHSWNRFFLLGALVGSFLVPFISLTSTVAPLALVELPTNSISYFSGDAEVLIPTLVKQEMGFSPWILVFWIYLAVVGFSLVRSVFYISFIFKLKKQSDYVNKHWYKLFKTAQERSFSFFSSVFIPTKTFGTCAFDQILAHECVHVRQRHSVDRLLMDLMISLFWFNPFMYLYRNALIEIHEYQADERVIAQYGDPRGYQEILFAELQSSRYSGLVSHFNFSTIKKRIVMINKRKNRFSPLKYAIVLPLISLVIFAFSGRQASTPFHSMSNEIVDVLGPFPSVSKGGNIIEYQNAEIPEICPLKLDDKIRVTSHFGMRYDPIEKVKKHHSGIDFRAPVGTEIMATADGKVVVSDEFSSWGKRIDIEHSDGFLTRFAHLSELGVKEGEMVKKGQIIGATGNSGLSKGPHLHYSVIKDSNPVNPVDYIKDYNFQKDDASGVKTGSMRNANEDVYAHLQLDSGILRESFEKQIEALNIQEMELTKVEATEERYLEAMTNQEAALVQAQAKLIQEEGKMQDSQIKLQRAELKLQEAQLNLNQNEKKEKGKEKQKQKDKDKKKPKG